MRGSGASRDGFASGDSPTHLSLTLAPGARGEQSAAGQEERLDRGDSTPGLLGTPRKIRDSGEASRVSMETVKVPVLSDRLDFLFRGCGSTGVLGSLQRPRSA